MDLRMIGSFLAGVVSLVGPSSACAQSGALPSSTLASGNFVGLNAGAVQVNEGGQLKTIPLRVTATVSIRGPFEMDQLQKGMRVAVTGMIEDGSKTVQGWSMLVCPFTVPEGIHSVRYEPAPDKKGFWELDAVCEVVSTNPLTVKILPGNEFAAAVYEDTTKSYWYTEYKGPRPIGMSVPLSDEDRRGPPMIEFGRNPQYAGAGATATVYGGGIPPMAERVRIVRTEAFKIDPQMLKKKR